MGKGFLTAYICKVKEGQYIIVNPAMMAFNHAQKTFESEA
jgi:hypothetical protein